jgi:hypothetical protein
METPMSETFDLPVETAPLLIHDVGYRERLVRFFVHNEGLRPAELADALIEWQTEGQVTR